LSVLNIFFQELIINIKEKGITKAIAAPENCRTDFIRSTNKLSLVTFNFSSIDKKIS
jgi:hypothetical protein